MSHHQQKYINYTIQNHFKYKEDRETEKKTTKSLTETQTNDDTTNKINLAKPPCTHNNNNNNIEKKEIKRE